MLAILGPSREALALGESLKDLMFFAEQFSCRTWWWT